MKLPNRSCFRRPEFNQGRIMFSDHLRKDIDELPRINLVAIAAVLIVICQLIAMAFVADGQVQKAGQRDLQRLAQQAAIAECVERNSGPMRHGCIQQVQAALDAARNTNSDSPVVRIDSAENVTQAAFDERATAGVPVRLATKN
jgi:hypothetical protein